MSVEARLLRDLAGAGFILFCNGFVLEAVVSDIRVRLMEADWTAR